MKYILISSLFIYCGSVTSQSKQPIKSEDKPKIGKYDREKTDQDQRGTKNLPFVVDVIISKEAESKTAYEKGKEDEKTSFDFWMVIWAGIAAFVAAVQAGLFLYQLRLMQSTIKDSTAASKAALKSAEIAEKSFNSYMSKERAWMACIECNAYDFSNPINPKTGEAGPSGVILSLKWKNTGPTPATKCRLQSHMAIEDVRAEFPSFSPKGETAPSPIAPGHIVDSGTIEIMKNEIDDWKKGLVRIIIYGRIDYFDIFFGTGRHTETCMRMEFGGFNSENKQTIYRFLAVGPQNSAD